VDVARWWKQSPRHGEQDDQLDGEPVAGDGDTNRRREARRLVDPATGSERGEDAQRQPDQEPEHHRHHDEAERDREAFGDVVGDGNVREQRLPEVTLYRVAQPPSVLLEEGLVEMELVFDLLDPFRRRVLAAGEG